jgi:hypothetical protein
MANSMAQMSYCSKYSPESVFPEVTAAIVDAIALHSAVNSGCSAVSSGCRGAISHSPDLLPANLGHQVRRHL